MPKFLMNTVDTVKTGMILFVVISFQFSCFNKQLPNILQSSIIGLLFSIYFSLTTRGNAVFLPGFLQLIFLLKKEDSIHELLASHAVFLSFFYFSGITALIHKMMSRLSELILALIIILMVGSAISENITTLPVLGVHWYALIMAGLVLIIFKARQTNQNQNSIIIGAFALVTFYNIVFSKNQLSHENLISTFTDIQPVALINFQYNLYTNKILGKGLLLSLLTVFETSIALKSHSRITNFENSNQFCLQLTITNFIFAIFGIFPISASFLSNRFLENTSKKAHIFILLGVLKLLVLNQFIGFFSHSGFFIFVFGLAIIGKLISDLTVESQYARLFRNSSKNIICFVLTLMTFYLSRSKLITFIFSVLVELVCYLFQVYEIGNYRKHKNFDDFEKIDFDSENAIVYEFVGGFNFCFAEYHFNKIMDLFERHVILDFRKVMKKSDANYSDSYRDLIQKLEENSRKKFYFVGLENWISKKVKIDNFEKSKII